MALIPFPQAADHRIAGFATEVYYPSRVVMTSPSGTVLQDLERGAAKWMGTLTLDPWATEGEPDAANLAAVETWRALMSDPAHFTDMPWGGDPPFYRTPGNWAGRVTATLNGVHTLTRFVQAGAPDTLEVNDWLTYGGRGFIVASVAGTPAAPQITTHPVVAPHVADVFGRCGTLRVRSRTFGEGGGPMPRTGSFGGRFSWQWVEL